MKRAWSGIILSFLIGVTPATAQQPQTLQEAQALAQKIAQQTAQKPLMAEEVFKNVQILKGIPVNQFMETMGFFAASIGLNCVYCHVSQSLENWDRFADDVPRKRMARSMMLMVKELNKTKFGGRRAVLWRRTPSGGCSENQSRDSRASWRARHAAGQCLARL